MVQELQATFDKAVTVKAGSGTCSNLRIERLLLHLRLDCGSKVSAAQDFRHAGQARVSRFLSLFDV